MTDVLGGVRAHLAKQFAADCVVGEPQSANVTFLGVEPIEVVRFGPTPTGVVHHVSLGCSRYPMHDPAGLDVDPIRGPRAEVVVSLKPSSAMTGLARTVAVLAATPAVEGVVLCPDALVDLGQPLWQNAPFTAFLLSRSDIEALPLAPPRDPVKFLRATPVTATEAAWVRLRGADALREAWREAGVDLLDAAR